MYLYGTKLVQKYSSEVYLKYRIDFLGALSGEELNLELNKCKYIIAAPRWNEAFGLVIIEGMAAGCIPIYSDGDGLCEAANKIGFIFKKSNSLSMQKVLHKATSISEIQAQEIQRESQEWVESLSVINVVKRYLETVVQL